MSAETYVRIDADITSIDVTSPAESIAVWGAYSPLREGSEVVIQVTQGDRLVWVSLNPIQSAVLRNSLRAAETTAIRETKRERGF